MTLSTIDPEDVTFLDFVEEGQRLATVLLSQVWSILEVVMTFHMTPYGQGFNRFLSMLLKLLCIIYIILR